MSSDQERKQRRSSVLWQQTHRESEHVHASHHYDSNLHNGAEKVIYHVTICGAPPSATAGASGTPVQGAAQAAITAGSGVFVSGIISSCRETKTRPASVFVLRPPRV